MRHTHLGVYGVARRDNEILFIKKARGPYTGLFDLPGGKIEFGETPEQTLTREMKEETGLCIKNSHILFCSSVCFKHTATQNDCVEELHHIGMVYSITVEADDLIKTYPDGADANGALWLNLDQIDPKTLTPFAKMAVIECCK